MSATTQISLQKRLQGSIFLITGCCIGAGMIGLPIVTSLFGFFPSILVFFLAWAFMLSTGLLLLEATMWFQQKVNLLYMAENLLGKFGKYLSGGLFLFLFFSLIVAYLSETGSLLAGFFSHLMGLNIEPELGVVFCSLITGVILFKGTSMVDLFNRICVFGMILFYLMIVILGLPYIQLTNLSIAKFGKPILMAVPVVLIAFGYQNLVPGLTTYLNRDVKKIKKAIVLGCSIPFIVYILWQAIMLGLFSPNQLNLMTNNHNKFVTHLLSQSIGFQHINVLVGLFSFFALTTSLLTVALSCRDFLSDAIRLKDPFLREVILCITVMLFPTVFSLYNPNFFLKGLSIAGGIGAVLLFGVLPVLLVWVGRYRRKIQGSTFLPGGRLSLVCLFLISVFIFTLELLKQLNLV